MNKTKISQNHDGSGSINLYIGKPIICYPNNSVFCLKYFILVLLTKYVYLHVLDMGRQVLDRGGVGMEAGIEKQAIFNCSGSQSSTN